MTKRILLVEDERVDQLFIVRALKEVSGDVEIEVTGNGKEALNSIDEHGNPALIVTDLNMPIMDGHELLDTIRANTKLRKIPIIVLSTSDERKQIELSYEKFANAYIVKPNSTGAYNSIAQSLYSFWFKAAQLPLH